MKINPIIPFEPISSDKIPAGEQWASQVKWDGVRVLTYYDGRQVRLFNRRLNERTLQYPELLDIRRYCSAESVILDGEVVALAEGKPSFHEVMRRDGVRRIESVAAARRQVPVSYLLFDVLFCNGEWVVDQPLRQRQQLLADIVTPREDVQLVASFPDGPGLFEAVRVQGLEGIVCKDLNSSYLIGGKDARWRKVKNYRDLTAVVGGVTFNGLTVNAVLLGLYGRDGRLRYIGHAGSGRLTRAEWRALTERVRPLMTSERPFANMPERIKGAVWVRPEITARIQFAEWTRGQTLRQPSIQAFVDTPPRECMLEPQ
ncbi:MAG: DNA ligase [Syntrophomonadaceae bacterium]|nr:DNA ligase [Syntrophomonadaceae bacterium]